MNVDLIWMVATAALFGFALGAWAIGALRTDYAATLEEHIDNQAREIARLQREGVTSWK